MISRRTSSVPKDDVFPDCSTVIGGAPRLVAGAPRLVVVAPRCTQVSVSNGSSFGPGQIYRSAGQRPYPIKNRRFLKRTITLRPQILIREFSVRYVKYAAQRGASFGCHRFSISLNLSKQQPKNLVFRTKMTIISKQVAKF